MSTPRFDPYIDPYIVPISFSLLIGLFLVQRRGTAAVGTVLHRPTREAAYAATRSPDRLVALGQTRSSFAKYS
jgi:hypothetical protein